MDQVELQVALGHGLLSGLALHECYGARGRDLSGATRIGAASQGDAVFETDAP